MNAPAGILRGPAASRALGAFGIHARRYWLLMDLFRHLSENRDMFSQLGRDDTSLKVVTFLYFGMASLASVVAVLTRASLHTYFYTALGYSTFVVLSILLPETSNSLVNPVEGLVLAHQPINGATYTAAKLSHLLRIVVYLEGGLNAVPALAGSLLPNAPSYYPLVHLGSALALGLLSALACCAVFGWLIRFLPARRLKAAGQMAEIAPWMVLMLRDPLRELLAAARIPQRAAALLRSWALHSPSRAECWRRPWLRSASGPSRATTWFGFRASYTAAGLRSPTRGGRYWKARSHAGAEDRRAAPGSRSFQR